MQLRESSLKQGYTRVQDIGTIHTPRIPHRMFDKTAISVRRYLNKFLLVSTYIRIYRYIASTYNNRLSLGCHNLKYQVPLSGICLKVDATLTPACNVQEVLRGAAHFPPHKSQVRRFDFLNFLGFLHNIKNTIPKGAVLLLVGIC